MSQSESNKFFSRERRRFNKIVISTALLLGFLGLAIVPPIVNFETTARVVTHFITGEKIDCSQNVLPINTSKPYDAIVIPGAGFYKENGNFIPNTAERKRLLAGALEYVNGKSDVIILQDGILPQGADQNITREWLKAYIRVISEFTMEIPDEAIIVDEKSFNTASGMSELKKNSEKYGTRNYLVIDSKTHGNRSVADGCDLGLAMTWEEAETLTALIDPNQAIINSEEHSPPFSLIFKETTELISNAYVPGGGLTVPIKKISLDIRNSNTGLEIGHYFPTILTATILSLKKIRKLKKERSQK